MLAAGMVGVVISASDLLYGLVMMFWALKFTFRSVPCVGINSGELFQATNHRVPFYPEKSGNL